MRGKNGFGLDAVDLVVLKTKVQCSMHFLSAPSLCLLLLSFRILSFIRILRYTFFSLLPSWAQSLPHTALCVLPVLLLAVVFPLLLLILRGSALANGFFFSLLKSFQSSISPSRKQQPPQVFLSLETLFTPWA